MKYLLPNIILSLCFCLVSLCVKGQACIPNNDTVSGITPDTLAVAYANVPYEEIIYFRLPADTIVAFVNGPDTIFLTVCIDSLTIDSVKGLPEGFSYACNVPWCSVLGGGNGCASITGTTQNTGIYPLQVFVTIYVNDCISASLPAQVDTVTLYFIDVEEPNEIESFVGRNDFSLGKIFPNPSKSEVTVPFNLPASGSVSISVLNLDGRICLEKTFEGKRGYNKELLDVSQLNDGPYFIQVKNDCGSQFSKIQVLKN